MTRTTDAIGPLFSWTSANWITIFGGQMALLGGYSFIIGSEWIAVVVLTLSFLTDWIDGAVGRYQQNDRPPMTREEESQLSLWQRLNYRGVTHLGRALDPFIDKLRFIGLLWIVGYEPLPHVVLWSFTALAAMLTLIRPIKRQLNLGHAGSNRFGKHKVHVEVIGLTLLVFTTRPLWSEVNPLWNSTFVQAAVATTLLTAFLLGLASLWGHIEGALYHTSTPR